MSSDTRTISQLPLASALTGIELIPVVQDGITKRATVDQIQMEALGGQQFITVNSDPGLPQSRQLTATGGLQFTDNGPLSSFELSTIGLLNSLSALGASGIIVNNGGVSTARTLIQPSAGITISNADGVAGNPTFSLANDLAALEGLSSTGFSVRTGTDTWVQRSVAGTANEITVTNGSGVGGNPTISLPAALTFTGKTITGGLFTSGTTLVAPVIFIADDALNISDNVDPSKSFQFQASGITTGTTRIFTVPDANDTLAVLGLAQTLTNKTLISPIIAVLANLTTNGYVKTSGGVGTLSVQTTPIPVTDGGTGFASYAVGDIIYADTTATLAKLPDVAAGSYLRSGGVNTAPSWSTVTLPNSAVTGDLLYASAANVYSNLADVVVGNALLSGGVGVAPSWGRVSLTTAVIGTLPVANGGTGATTFTARGILLGEGTSPIVATAAMTGGQILVGQTGADPIPKTVSGDATLAASGALTIANNAVTNAKLADMATQTIKGRTTAGTGDPEDLTSAQISTMLAPPQVTVLTSGSGTYTRPTGAKYLQVELVGGGGGGAGSGTSPGAASNGGTTTFGTAFLTSAGGLAGRTDGGAANGSLPTGGDLNVTGGQGGAAFSTAASGGIGGGSYYGSGGTPGLLGGGAGSAGAPFGSGGGGGGSAATANAGGGGGAAGYLSKLITSPLSTYSYGVGGVGGSGTAGTGGAAGGTGASGIIIITAYFQ